MKDKRNTKSKNKNGNSSSGKDGGDKGNDDRKKGNDNAKHSGYGKGNVNGNKNTTKNDKSNGKNKSKSIPRSNNKGNKSKEKDNNSKDVKPDFTIKTKGSSDKNNNNSDNNNHKVKGSNNYKRKQRYSFKEYPDHTPLSICLQRYAKKDKTLIRGKLRVVPGGSMAFISCDRGSYNKDVVIDGEWLRNRALDGDNVFVDITGITSEEKGNNAVEKDVVFQDDDDNNNGEGLTNEFESKLNIKESTTNDDDDDDYNREEQYDNTIQKSLWDPAVQIRRKKRTVGDDMDEDQYTGQVICVILPKASALPGNQPSELNPTIAKSNQKSKPKRTIVGTVMPATGKNNNRYLFVPNSRCLPRFITPSSTRTKMIELHGDDEDKIRKQLCFVEYVYESWSNNDKWPPCINLKVMGQSCNVEDETMALLMDNGVNHGDFQPGVLKDVDEAVTSGRMHCKEDDEDLGWEPTPEMLKGRRDYRKERIFTIDPTTAKDLDDALHIRPLSDGRVEIGVHIADVSHFVKPGTHVDYEAERRSTTVYLVDRTVPMLPRPLCEIACSLNENVERLAFSCVWTMNKDGTLATKKGKNDTKDIWYGRTVIKSCARLDYATAQNIIDRKVGTGEKASDVDEKLWPKSRQPTGGHTIDKVAADVRLMHSIAMERRKLRFKNGSLALNGVKLTFQLKSDNQTPALCAPYPIRDSNRLIEEYMLLANFLVAQRLITHAGDLAVLRKHPPPLQQGIQQVVDIAKETGHHIDSETSKTLQESLSKMGRECQDKLIMQCVTEMLMVPMCPAEYIAAGTFNEDEWHHFALNIPYYTHFTSPIRRYPDILVHRLLQATLDGDQAVKKYHQKECEIQSVCDHCNDKRMASKKAQERSDRVFLSIFLKDKPIISTLGVVVGIGEKTFKVFVPKIGITQMVYLDEHKDLYNARVEKNDKGQRQMTLLPIQDNCGPRLDIYLFTKIEVSCICKEVPPIDVSIRIIGNWTGEQ